MIQPCSVLPSLDEVSATEDCERIAESYKFSGRLGRGTQGEAFEVIHNQELMVVKVLELNQEGINEIDTQCELNNLSEKTGIFARAFGWLVCDKIPDGWAKFVKFRASKYLFIFMEKALKGWKDRKRLQLNEYDYKKILYLLIEGLAIAREDIGFSHDNLHVENLMLQPVEGKTNVRFVPKLIDFGKSFIGEDSDPEDDDFFERPANYSGTVKVSEDMSQIAYIFGKAKLFPEFFDSQEYVEAEQTGRNDYEPLKRLLQMEFFKDVRDENTQIKCVLCAHSAARFQWKGMSPEYRFCSESCAMYWGKGIGQFLKDAYYVTNIELDTLNNRYFGPAVQYNDPSGHIQVALMSVAPGKRVPLETHAHLSQFIRVERGYGELIMGKKTYELRDGFAAVIPAGTPHEIVNMGQRSLKLYTLYCKDAADAFEH